MEKKPIIIAVVCGAVGHVLAGYVGGALWAWSSSVFGFLFQDWFVSRGYTNAVYYFGSFWVSLPTSAVAFLLGLGLGFFLRGHVRPIASASVLGWLAAYIIIELLGGIWWLGSLPYSIVFTLSLALSLALLCLGALCGNRIGKRTKL